MIAGIVLVLAALIGTIILVTSSDGDIPPFMIAIVFAGVLGGGLLAKETTKESVYKQGQVDALTGKVKYELYTNADSTKTWELK